MKSATKLTDKDIKELFAVAVFRPMGDNPAFLLHIMRHTAFLGVSDEFALIAEVEEFIFIRDSNGLVIVDSYGIEVEIDITN